MAASIPECADLAGAGEALRGGIAGAGKDRVGGAGKSKRSKGSDGEAMNKLNKARAVGLRWTIFLILS